MKNSIWEVEGIIYDIKKEGVNFGLNIYEIDLILDDGSFTAPRVYADCFARNENERNLIENLSAEKLITLRGEFKSIATHWGGYLYLDNCVIIKVGNKKLNNKEYNKSVLSRF